MKNKHASQFICLGFFLLCQFAGIQKTLASVEVSFSKIITLPTENTVGENIDISVYIDQSRLWTEQTIITRLKKINKFLAVCQLQISNVYIFDLKLSEPAVRMDDQEHEKIYYDGFRAIVKKSQKVTPVQLFYIQKYLNPSPSQKQRPYVIHADSQKTPSWMHGTVWFPEDQEVGSKTLGDSSIEAQELGVLFTKDNSHQLKNNHFTTDQCHQFDIPKKYNDSSYCGELKETLNPLFSTFYKKFGQHYYMSLYCVRNSQNLYKKLIQIKPEFIGRVQNVLMIHKDLDKSLKPLIARGSAQGWSNHSVLMIDGLVLDLDFSAQPTLLPVSEYLSKMWGEGQSDVLFLWRPADAIQGFTNLEVRDTFQSKKHPVALLDGFMKHYSKLICHQ